MQAYIIECEIYLDDQSLYDEQGLDGFRGEIGYTSPNFLR